MAVLPVNRSTTNTATEHVNDHNELHRLHNDLDGHLADTVDSHDASSISFIPAGTVAATNVQAAIEEVASEAGGAHPNLAAHDSLGLATQAELDAHAAGPHGTGSITVQDESTTLSGGATTFNFIGRNIKVTGSTATKTVTAYGPEYDFREWGSATGDITTLLQTAANDVMDAGSNGGRLIMPRCSVQISGLVQFQGLDSPRIGKRCDLLGSGVGNTIFNLINAGALLALNEPFIDGSAVSSTSTTVTAATGFFTGKVGRTLVSNTPTYQEKEISAVNADGSVATVGVAYTTGNNPTAGSPITIAGSPQGPRGHYAGHFSVNGNNLANTCFYIGRGASKFIEYIRCFNAGGDGFLFQSVQNSSFFGLESIDAGRDNFALTRGVGNIWLFGCYASTGGRSNLHMYQAGLTAQSSVNDKVLIDGGLYEDGKLSTNQASVWIESGNEINLHAVAINAASADIVPAGTQSALWIKKEPTWGGPTRVTLSGGQIDPRNGIGIRLGGIGAGGGLTELHIPDHPHLKQNPPQGYMQWDDDNVGVWVSSTMRYWNSITNKGTPHSSSSSTRKWQDVVTINGARNYSKVNDTSRFSTATLAPDPDLRITKIETNAVYELSGRIVIDGPDSANCRIRLAVTNGVTFSGSIAGPATSPSNDDKRYFESGTTLILQTFGIGTKVVFDIRGQVRGGTTNFGTLDVEWAQEFSDPGNLTFYKNGTSLSLRENGTSAT